MKALVFDKPQSVVWRDVPEPICAPFGAVMRPVAVSPCSSDIHTIFEGGVPKSSMHVLGHECIAEIIQIGSEVVDFKVGDVVAVPAITPNWRATAVQEGNERHAVEHFDSNRLGRTWPGVFAELFAVPDADTTLAHIPKGVNLKQALMCVDVMTTGFTGAEYANIKTGDTVCVIGIGPVGLMAVAAASNLGAAEIYAIGSRPNCKQLAMQYGATDIIDYKDVNIVQKVLELTDNVGSDSVIIAGGNDKVFTQAIDMVRYGIGTVSNVNYYGDTGSLAFPKFSGGRGMAGKTIHTELAKGGRARIERMLKMVKFGRVNPEPLVTHVLNGFEQIEKAIYLMRDKPDNLIKVMVEIKW